MAPHKEITLTDIGVMASVVVTTQMEYHIITLGVLGDLDPLGGRVIFGLALVLVAVWLICFLEGAALPILDIPSMTHPGITVRKM